MARNVAGLDLSAFHEHWLAKAELSVLLPERSKKGLSLFLNDEPEFSELLSTADLPWGLLEHERSLRSKFDLVSRYWLKLHYGDSNITGYSQYFQIHPLKYYPITTLRLFLKMYGVSDVTELEELVRPALDSRETIYGLVLKHDPNLKRVAPRLSLRVRRNLLAGIMCRFVSSGLLTFEAMGSYLRWDEDISTSDFTYFSFDPGVPGGCSLDFEDVARVSLPLATELNGRALPDSFNFVKCRLGERGEPEWTPYFMLSALRSELEWSPDGTPREVNHEQYVDEVRNYYDKVSPVAVEHVGTTYQAGLFRSGSCSRDSNLWLAERARIKAGDHILDAGCGVGGPSIDIAHAYSGVTIEAVTLSEVQAEEARRQVATAGLDRSIQVRIGDYHKLRYANNRFDLALFLESFGYAYDVHRLLTNIYRMLRPRGRIYIKYVFRLERLLSPQELEELGTFNRLYAFRVPMVERTMGALVEAGFTNVESQDISPEVDMRHFNRAMFVTGSRHLLNNFGKRHFHEFTTPPVTFWEINAEKKG